MPSKPSHLSFLVYYYSVACLWIAAHVSYVSALPNGPVARATNDSQDTGIHVVLPVVLVVVALILLVIAIYRKGSSSALRRGLAHISNGAVVASGTAPPTSNNTSTRELTAEQLAGGIPANNRDTTAGAQNRTTARRPRRARRTPSQMSTTSLPVYMKEPGEQELVVFSGPEEMEDVEPTTIIMPAVDEDDTSVEDEGDDAAATTENQQPSTGPTHDNENHENHENTRTHQRDPSAGAEQPTYRSEDTHDSSETTSLLEVSATATDAPDPRGEAPPYSEGLSAHVEEPGAANAPEAPTADDRRRSSRFRNIISALNPNSRPTSTVGTTAPPLPTAPRLSTVSSVEGPPSCLRMHRPSQSVGSSLLRTISRQRSSNTLNSGHFNSPSMISLNSISSPLTHTLTKSEITYPRAGPTPEQMKLISSRESFSMFQRPYGPDAIAFAASASRPELPPPPSFDSIDGMPVPSNSSQLNLRSTPSRLSHSPHPSTSSSNEVPAPAAGTAPSARQEDVSSSPSSEVVESEQQQQPIDELPRVQGEERLSSVPQRSSSPEPMDMDSKALPEVAPKVKDSATSPFLDDPTVRQRGTAPGALMTPTSDVSEFGAYSKAPATAASKTITKASRPKSSTLPPPSSLKPNTVVYEGGGTAASRMSSVTSFATAAESFVSSSATTEMGEVVAPETPVPSQPTTPRGATHELEGTDATVTPTRAAIEV